MTTPRAQKPFIIFASASYNLLETTRLVEIAKAAQDEFTPLFISYGGPFERLIVEEGFLLKAMYPRLHDKKIQHLYRCIRGETLQSPFTVAQLRQRVAREVALYQETNPVAVVTGFCLSVPLSCRLHGVPLVWLVNSTWMKPYYQSGLFTWPDALDLPFLGKYSYKVLNRAARHLWYFNAFLLRAFNRTARQLGMQPFKGMDFWEGDYALVAEPPEFSGLMLPPPKYHYIGPIVTRLQQQVPPEVAALPRDKPIIYFAMGSSGKREIIAHILTAFRNQSYRVIAPVKAHLNGVQVNIPDNVLVTDWLPAHEVNRLADVSVIHGGIGTVMNACLAGTPIVGVGMQPEQEANLECLVRKGFAIRIKKKRVSAPAVLSAIDKMLHNPAAKAKALEFQEILRQYDGPGNAARFLAQTFVESPGED